MISDHAFPTIAASAPLLASRRISSVELTRHCLARVARHDATMHAFVTLTEKHALAAAARADREIAAGKHRGPLHGIPYAVKDVFDTRGIRTTGGSKAFLNNVPRDDAFVVQRLDEAGAVLLGKLSLHELTYGGVDFDAGFPLVRNPWDTDRDPGGSSSGSAAAVAAGLCLASVGTDTGGSVRLPAGLCGIVGLKPTFGRVSRRGVMGNAHSLDHCGPMAWTARDCALILQAIAGHDPADPASVDVAVPDYAAALRLDLRGVRIGVVAHFFERDLPAGDEARAAIEAALAVLRDLGAQIRAIELRPLESYAQVKALIQRPEIFDLYGEDARIRPQLFGRKFRARIEGGDRVTAVDYVRAQRQRRELMGEMAAAMSTIDALCTCGAYGPAPRLADVAAATMRNQAEITVPFSVTGYPAISVCAGFSREGMPLSLQIAGKPFDEATILRIAHAYEHATAWRDRRPDLASPHGGGSKHGG